MSIFKKKKGAHFDQISNMLGRVNYKSTNCSNKLNEDAFEEALRLTKSDDRGEVIKGRCRLDDMSSKLCYNPDPRAIMWAANEYYDYGCPSIALEYYERAIKLGMHVDSRIIDYCKNPYHLNNFGFDLRYIRGCGTQFVNRMGNKNPIQKKQEEDFQNSIEILDNNPSENEARSAVNTISLIANARGCSVPEAFLWMGDYCESVKKDDTAAVEWYKKAADLQNSEGMRRYADMLMIGKGIEANQQKAMECYEEAANKGHKEAQFIVAQYYEKQSDINRAIEYYKKSAKQGYVIATEKLKALTNKANEYETAQSEIQELGNNQEKLESPNDFYSTCVKDFHSTAKIMGYADNGLIFIPELIPFGEKAVLAFLQDNSLRAEYGANPVEYYYIVTELSIQAGMVFSEMWHKRCSLMNDDYVDYIIDHSPADKAQELMESLFDNDAEKSNEFYSKIYERLMTLHIHYWNLEDPREYTFNGILAAYQIGISIVLAKYGL